MGMPNFAYRKLILHNRSHVNKYSFLLLQFQPYHQVLSMVREPLQPKMELESIISMEHSLPN